jgi:N-acylneuraminate cytidylyltransferase
MPNLCIIPARGGSKRIPRKNIKDFLGKPIIAYSIEVALKSGLFDEVMVSTDDEEIAEIALQYGAKVPFIRSKENADDFATLSDVIEEVKTHYSDSFIYFDRICCILATVPFVTADLLTETLQKMVEEQLDSVRPIIKFSYPPQRAVKLADNKICFVYPEFSKTRSQDLEPIYHDSGMFYWMDYTKGLTGLNKGAIIISEKFAQDIDSVEDWEIAEFKYKNFK